MLYRHSREAVYKFYLMDYDLNGKRREDVCSYLVVKDSKNVYAIPHQGFMDVYQI